MPADDRYEGAWGKVRWLARFYRSYLFVVAVLLLGTPLQALVESVVPRMVGFTIDSLNGETLATTGLIGFVLSVGESMGLNQPATFASAFLVIGVVSFAMYATLQSTRAWMNVRLEWAFRQDAFDRITEKGPDFFQRFRIGDLVTRLTDDVAEKLSWFACSGIFRLYEAIMKIVFITLMMILIDPVLAFWMAGPLPLLIAIYIRGGILLDRRYEKLQACISAVNDRLEACFSGIRVVKAYAREQAQDDEFVEVARKRRRAEIESVRAMTVIESLWHSVWQFGVLAVLLGGGWRVLHGGLTIGEMATFLYYTVWLVFPMFDIGQFVVKSRQSGVSIGRLLDLELVPPMVRDDGEAEVPADAPVSIRFRQTDFSFQKAERPRAKSAGEHRRPAGETRVPHRQDANAPPSCESDFTTAEHKVLDNVDLLINAGQTVAVVGRVGAGKSWLVNLLPRLADPTSGSVEIGGRDLREIRLAGLRGMIGFVPQEPSLFSDTVRNNVTFGREDIDDKTLAWALDVSQFRADIERFPKREETRVGTRGVALSGGQKQRLALARALVGKPRVLVLDDCTSALDSQTEAALWDRLRAEMPDLTTVLITHRPDTLRLADRIFVLRDGRVVESGTHDELIAAGDEYRTIYRKYELEELLD